MPYVKSLSGKLFFGLMIYDVREKHELKKLPGCIYGVL